ncbi:MAG: hypothetical protein AB7Q37_17235 [Pyrinomonadaceae bacterium]
MKAGSAISDQTDDSRWKSLYVRKIETETAASFRLFRSFGIEPLLIKGWAIARMYPPEKLRYYGDVDLAVAETDLQKASEIKDSAEGVRLSIDLHRELRHFDPKPWKEVLTDSRLVKLDGESIRIPSEEDHLRILAAHWLNDGGEDREKLWDIYYAVENRSVEFDWSKCLDAVGHARRSWVIAAIGLAHIHLGLSIDDLPFRDQAASLPKWLERTVERAWASGTKLRSLPMASEMRGQFLVQVKKRIPPNPIQATIEAQGDLFGHRRFLYQALSVRKRAIPSIKNLWLSGLGRIRRSNG